jgi:hypothetical protein
VEDQESPRKSSRRSLKTAKCEFRFNFFAEEPGSCDKVSPSRVVSGRLDEIYAHSVQPDDNLKRLNHFHLPKINSAEKWFSLPNLGESVVKEEAMREQWGPKAALSTSRSNNNSVFSAKLRYLVAAKP